MDECRNLGGATYSSILARAALRAEALTVAEKTRAVSNPNIPVRDTRRLKSALPTIFKMGT
jgi:hypothetical protein